jgi:hypothetical protein
MGNEWTGLEASTMEIMLPPPLKYFGFLLWHLTSQERCKISTKMTLKYQLTLLTFSLPSTRHACMLKCVVFTWRQAAKLCLLLHPDVACLLLLSIHPYIQYDNTLCKHDNVEMKSLLSLVLLISTVSHHHVVSFSSMSHACTSSNSITLVVISPPGDTVGQVAAVETARLGHHVKWFIVSSSEESSSSSSQMSLTPFALAQIQEAGGSVELAGATATNLLSWSSDNDDDASSALVKWCQNANGLICCMDGIPPSLKGKIDEEDPRKMWMDGIKVAAQQASATISGSRVAILAAKEDDENEETTNDSGMGGLLKSVMGAANNKGPTVPSSLASAMSTSSGGGGGGGTLVKLRHGQLFGIPESSVRSTLIPLRYCFYIAYIAYIHIIFILYIIIAQLFGTGGWSSQGCHPV